MNYKDVLDVCFDKPPRDTYRIVENLRLKYRCYLVSIDDYAYLTLVERAIGYYEICWVVVHPDWQHMGIGTLLLGKMFRDFKGVFITKTNNARNFYLKNGFQEVYFNGNTGKSVLIAINDIGNIN